MMAVIKVPALGMTGAQLRGVLLALSAAVGGLVEVPELPIAGEDLRVTLLALEAEIGSGAIIPELPISAEALRLALVTMSGAVGAVDDGGPAPGGPAPGVPYTPRASGGGVLTGTTEPGPADGQNGDVFVLTADGLVSFYGPKTAGDWGEPFAILDAAPAPPPRRVLLEDPTAGELLPLDQAPFAAPLEVVRISTYVRGAGAEVTFNLEHGPDPSGPGVELVTGGIVAAAGSSAVVAFDAPVIPAGHWLWLTISATAGNVELVTIGVDWAR